ncbi:MAG: Crp/Fnr family transcriptional regulator [Ktedonobacterales bacterium]|nr:Crp/Fnr family transcriptional regulator [Ktedonobacterales bacterium]
MTTAPDMAEGPQLDRVAFFADLDAPSLEQIAGVMRKRTFRAGEAIFHRDDPGQVLYVIREGRVRIRLTSVEGQEVALAVFGPGDSFGEMAILDSQPRSADAIAIDKVEVFTLQRPDFVEVVRKHPDISVAVMKTLSQRIRQANQMVEDLIFLDVFGRVAKKLLDLSREYGVETEDGVKIDLRITQQELASMVGASRESVNKVMGYFTDKHYISTDKHKITIRRIADLQKRIY